MFGAYGMWVWAAVFGLGLLCGLFVLLICGISWVFVDCYSGLFAIMWFGCYCLVWVWVCLCCVDLDCRLRVV